MKRLPIAALAVLSVGCVTPSYVDLPDKPLKSHRFGEYQRKRVEVTLPGRAQPVGIGYVEAGRADAPPLLLVHGLNTTSYSWRYIIPALAERYRVLVPDLPGGGKSDSPADLSASPKSISNVLAAFSDAVGAPKAYVVGNSMGGYLTGWYALEHPEKVSRLMIMHAPGFPELRLKAMKLALATGAGRCVFRSLVADPRQFTLDNLHYRDPAMVSKEEIDEYSAKFEDPAATEVFIRVLSESMDPDAMEEFGARLPKLGMPVRLLWSRQDVLVPPGNGPRYQALLPAAELVWVDDSSHFLQVDSPQRTVEEIVRFDGP